MSVFERNAWCLLGIPIDVISYQQAIAQVSSSVIDRQRCFFSTPNLNFIIASLSDKSFLSSVICSDLVLLDGMPPVWIARLLGIPGVKKISGSNLFETLCETAPAGDRKIRVFLFGGEEGVAAEAGERINRLAMGLECVGYYYPGFGSTEDMSGDDILEQVNASDADFVVVALGAKKGQSWIMSNRDALQAPVISHLGAVVNFAAAKVARAPLWMQTFGVEWIWRIYQEPSLWKRYLLDGFRMLQLFFFKIIPYVLWRGIHSRQLKNSTPVECSVIEDEKAITIHPKGDCTQGTIAPFRALFHQESTKGKPITLNLAEVGLIDGAFLGLCLLLYKQAMEQIFILRFTGVSPAQQRVFKWNCVEYLL
jgi:N-acetylglucosaminyldiphosphoundecaprenol N-acetyl-beta-D-mannosaminyltransferase